MAGLTQTRLLGVATLTCLLLGGGGAARAQTPTAPAVDAAPAPAPAAARATGLVSTSASKARLLAPPASVTRETVPDSAKDGDLAQYAVFASWAGPWGPWVGGSFGMFRAFRVDLGATQRLTYRSVCVGSRCENVIDGRAGLTFGWAISVAIVSYNGVEGSFGLAVFDNHDVTPTARLALTLDAAWLPFRVPKTRVFLSYPIGLGVEWGSP